MKIHYCEQGSPEWHEHRRGKMTASHGQAIGNNGRGLDTYIYDVVSQLYIINPQIETYTNPDIERGKELEPIAREAYQFETFNTVEQVGFIEADEYVGCSPDGLIDNDGGIEIKCVNNANHFKLIVQGVKAIESKYIWQIQMNMLITDRKYWDYVSYNNNFERSLIIHRITPDPIMFKKLEVGIEKGKNLIRELKKRYSQNN